MTKKKMSPGMKYGLGLLAGVAVLGVAAVAFADDEPSGSGGDEPSGSGGDGSSTPAGGGDSTPRRSSTPRATPPPNLSGDPKGYNATMFGTPGAVRSAFETLGYSTPNVANLGPSTRSFQADYTAVSRGFTLGKLSLPNAPAVSALVRGQLEVDGDPGPNTLRALEIALLIKQSGALWYPLVSQARALATSS
jgi:hypothetical protein